MSFQVRHKELGIYQGSCMGLGFWHPLSEMPEQGYCEFPSLSDAVEFILFVSSKQCSQPLKYGDLSIEPFADMESFCMVREGLLALGIGSQFMHGDYWGYIRREDTDLEMIWDVPPC